MEVTLLEHRALLQSRSQSLTESNEDPENMTDIRTGDIPSTSAKALASHRNGATEFPAWACTKALAAGRIISTSRSC
uniref:Uncharacterized protein n=1 Tax=Romanomermis culicivorax TaxID=13658 RepID=A0A915IBS2_ROMCU